MQLDFEALSPVNPSEHFSVFLLVNTFQYLFAFIVFPFYSPADVSFTVSRAF